MSAADAGGAPRAAAPPNPDDDTTVEFLTEIIDQFERLRRRAATVRVGSDAVSIQIAKEAVGVCRHALDDAKDRRASRERAAAPDTEPPWEWLHRWRDEIDREPMGRGATQCIEEIRRLWASRERAAALPPTEQEIENVIALYLSASSYHEDGISTRVLAERIVALWAAVPRQEIRGTFACPRCGRAYPHKHPVDPSLPDPLMPENRDGH